jgi:hypothetical protein
MPTPTERRIIQERNAAKSGAILVPILEQLLENEVIPEDEEDFRFLDMLARARALPRRKGVFSPSMLGSCMRQAYFAKRGTAKHAIGNPQTFGYFLNGNFIHFKWQFATWKAHRAGLLELAKVPIEDEVAIIKVMYDEGSIDSVEARHWIAALDFYRNGTRPGVEVRVVIGHDFGGTSDAVAKIQDWHVIDFKGVHLIDYQRTIKRGAKPEYRKQITGYAMNINDAGLLPGKIEDSLLVSECKAGPVSGAKSPLALHETRVPVAQFEGEVRRRVRTLRWHDAREEMPPPACTSLSLQGFQECPFNRYCQDEVKVIQRERQEKKAQEPAKPLRVNRVRH